MGVILKGKSPILKAIEMFHTENGNTIMINDLIGISCYLPAGGEAIIRKIDNVGFKKGENIGKVKISTLQKKTVNVNFEKYSKFKNKDGKRKPRFENSRGKVRPNKYSRTLI
jgi:hypothetical protein